MSQQSQAMEGWNLTIKVVNASNITIQVSNTMLIQQVKEQIMKEHQYDSSSQKLIFQGKILQNDKTIGFYNLTSDHVIHLAGAQKITSSISSQSNMTSSNESTTETLSPIQEALTVLIRQNSNAQVLTCLETLSLICKNIIENPTEAKYRKLKQSNKGLIRKIFSLNHGLACVKAIGFQDDSEEGSLLLNPTADAWVLLTQAKQSIDETLVKERANTSSTNNLPSGNSFVPPTSSFSGNSAFNPNMQSMLQMMQDPMMMQRIQQDPMMQQMAQNNPMMQQMLQNPALMQSALQQLQNNPQMMQQAQQMLQNPSQMANLSSQMNQPTSAQPFPQAANSNNPFMPGASSPAFPPTSSTPQSTSNIPPNSTSNSATSTTGSNELSLEEQEEREIAEAIARSLREQ